MTPSEEYFDANELEALTGIAAGTWRYWGWTGQGPSSFKLGRRRVWRKAVVRQWISEQEEKA